MNIIRWVRATALTHRVAGLRRAFVRRATHFEVMSSWSLPGKDLVLIKDARTQWPRIERIKNALGIRPAAQLTHLWWRANRCQTRPHLTRTGYECRQCAQKLSAGSKLPSYSSLIRLHRKLSYPDSPCNFDVDKRHSQNDNLSACESRTLTLLFRYFSSELFGPAGIFSASIFFHTGS